MAQLNVHLTPEFEKALAEYMKLRRLRTKSDAIRAAVLESLDREHRRRQAADFSRWLGMACKAPQNLQPQFRSDNDLWE